MRNAIFPLITDYELRLPYYVAGVGCFYNQEHIVRPHGYPYFQWIQCYRGRGKLKTEGSVYSIGESQGMLLYPNQPHEYFAVGASWEVDWIIFGGSQIGDFFKQSVEINCSGVYYVSQPEIILSKIRKVLEIEQSDQSMKGLECSWLAYGILLDIMKSTSLRNDSSSDLQYNRLQPVFDFIDKNYNRDFSLADLAVIADVTPQHLCNIFRKATSLRVFEYVNLVRIQKSKEHILQHRNMPLKEVARLSGYMDVSYFGSQFKRFEKIRPGEFRKLH